jgi:NAD+ synthase/NAD+ synthase (glutamine-hydrolysing)
MQIALAQLNQVVGDLAGNARSILAARGGSRARRAALVVTPELSLCGYPPEDLLLRPAFWKPRRASLQRLQRRCTRASCWSAFPKSTVRAATTRSPRCAMGAWPRSIASTSCRTTRSSTKSAISSRGTAPCVIEVAGVRVGLTICEDCWFPGPSRQARDAGAQLVVVANGSPYHTRQQKLRLEQVSARARETGLPHVYVNRVGGQDELVFDGASFIADASGNVAQQLPAWHETVAIASWENGAPKPVRGSLDERLEPHAYAALVMGVRDYVGKNRFPGVLLGLSGGIDSALTLAVAVDALGRERVRAVMMPSPYNAAMSLEDSRTMAGILGVRYDEIAIEPMMRAFGDTLADEFKGRRPMPPRRTSRRGSAARC